MKIVRFTRQSNGAPVYVQLEHITFIRQAEDDPSKTVLITLSEREVVSEDIDTAIGLWRGAQRAR